MSFYVRRWKPETEKVGWVGPIRSERQAYRESDAWREVGWQAEVKLSNAEVRSEVRSWLRAKKG